MRCAIVYPLFALYRLPIFQALVDTQTDDLEFCVYFDPNHKSSIKQAQPDLSQGKKWRIVKNIYFPFHFVWQRGVWRVALGREFQSIILLGDAYIVTNWIIALLARLRGKRVFFWTHGLYGNESRLKLLVRLAFYRLANGLFLYGNSSKRMLIENKFSPERIYVIYNSLDFEKQKAVARGLDPVELEKTKRQLFPSSSEAPILIFIGRLTARKQLGLLVEACHRLASKEHYVNVLFVGEGSELNSLKSLVKKYQLENQVVFAGPRYEEEEIAELMCASALCVSPGDIGLTAMHALTYGIPVVTHDDFPAHGPEFEAIVPGFNGEFFEKGNVDSLVEKIEPWLFSDERQSGEDLKKRCTLVIEKFFNPGFQKKVIEQAIKGIPAEPVADRLIADPFNETVEATK